MCGICGIFPTDPAAPVAEESLESMTAALRHRGPDSFGVLRGPGFGMGHARLSVVDLSGAADQPLSNEDGSLHLTFNGAIYNHRALRSELAARGHCFRSKTDGEEIGRASCRERV